MDRMAETSQPRVIKRYANRKLYDMSESCYITHEEIANLVEAGEEVRIIDNKTKEDLTTRTLTQILFEKERKNRRTLPLQTLRGLFQTSGDFIQRQIVQPVKTFGEEAEGNIRKIMSRTKDEEAEGEAGEEAAAVSAPAIEEPVPPTESAETAQDDDEAKKKGPDTIPQIREFMENSSKAVENLQATLEQRWNLIVNSIGHFDITSRRIAELERRVAELEATIAELKGDEETSS